MEELKERLKKLSATQTEQSGIADQTRGIADQIAKDLTEASADLLRRKAALDNGQLIIWILRVESHSKLSCPGTHRKRRNLLSGFVLRRRTRRKFPVCRKN